MRTFRYILSLLAATLALLAQPAEVRQEVLASLCDQPVDHAPVDLVELDQQHLVPDIHLHLYAPLFMDGLKRADGNRQNTQCIKMFLFN